MSVFGVILVRIQSERYGVSLPIQSECWEIRTRITLNTGTFYAVFLRSAPEENTDNFLEYSNTKEINYYLFESKVETYTKNDKTTEYTRTTRVYMKEKICGIVEKLLAISESYLRHRSHVNSTS